MHLNKTVVMRLAFAFDCPECGAENFIDSVPHEFSHDEVEDFKEETGERPEMGDWVTFPETVECCKCHAEFEATNLND